MFKTMRHAGVSIDLLEARALFSVSLSHGDLRISGSSKPDSVSVDLKSNKVVVLMNNHTTKFKASSVKSITATLGDGDDSYTATPAVKMNEFLHGGQGDDTIQAGSGNDVIVGEQGDDQLHGGVGNDSIIGNEGFDSVWGEAGSDTMGGGTGRDMILYDDPYHNALSEGVALQLTSPQFSKLDGWGHWGENDTILPDFEDARGSMQADAIFGNEFNNDLNGWFGDDVIFGGDGNDFIDGSAGTDTLWGEGGNDFMNSLDLAFDKVDGGSGSDFCQADKIDQMSTIESQITF